MDDLQTPTINLFNASTGALVGHVSEADLQLLQAALEEESDSDDDYYLNDPTIDVIEAAGASPRLLEALRAVLVDGEGDLRWERRS